ncbi:MAG: 4-phosphopantetheinyl transferase [Micromonosporaceae bacterium]|nr:4-phosphopantetheinyl transferase [Micromonosporaceae bacterium]
MSVPMVSATASPVGSDAVSWLDSGRGTDRYLVVRAAGVGGADAVEVAERRAAVLSAPERERAGRFHFVADRLRFTAARWLLRTTLAELTGIAPGDWEFEVGQRGKPAAHRRFGAAPAFNLAHSGGLAMVGVTDGRDIGVDVQDDRLSGGFARLLRSCASADETAQLRLLPEERQTDRFVALWVLKEAYLKARGLGIAAAPLPCVEFLFDGGDRPRLRLAPQLRDTPAAWRYQLIDAPSGYRAAVCTADT